jgi:hypothetical protein
MERFVDRERREWDVVLGRESWGAFVALFVPRMDDDAVIRQTALSASSYEAATQELAALDPAALQLLLDRSAIREG